MRTLFACKDTKAFCPHCNEHLFIFLKDVYDTDLPHIEDVVFQEGQAPTSYGEYMQCKKCLMLYRPGSIILEKTIKEDLK